jgi:hypothetical protein
MSSEDALKGSEALTSFFDATENDNFIFLKQYYVDSISILHFG